MSDVGQQSLPSIGTASWTRPVDKSGMPDQDTMYPVRVQCAKCPNKVTKYVKVRTLYAYPRNHPAISRTGVDRQIVVELWCLSCIRGANVEDDSQRTTVSIAQS